MGIITRKDLMTFEIVEKIKLHKAEAMLRGWAHRWKMQQRIKARERRRAEGEGQREWIVARGAVGRGAGEQGKEREIPRKWSQRYNDVLGNPREVFCRQVLIR